MAYAAIASLSQTIHIILNYHQNAVSSEFEDHIISLREHVIFLRSFLEDCPDEADSWEERICEVTSLAEDIIELLLSDSLLQSTVTTVPQSNGLLLSGSLLDSAVGSSNSQSGGQFRPLFQCCISAPAVTTSPLSDELLLPDALLDSTVGSKSEYEVRHDFDELERVIKEIESIAQDVKERHKEAADDSGGDLMQIISQLCDGEWSKPKFVAIVGRGGIGKTTLARNAFNHPTIVEQFQIRAWATVTQDYSERGVLSSLLRSMNMSNADDLSKSDHELSKSIEITLRHKRFLIVLDDVWSRTVLDTFCSIFPFEGHGSRIILSTRDSSLARIVFYTTHADFFGDGSRSYATCVHEMKVMNLDQSWKLLRQKIFKGNPCPPKLEYLGKRIAESCRGLPLTVAVVSGILAVDWTEAAWEDILENLTTSIGFEDDKHISQILYMSYTHLPHHLRPLLLYLGMFSKDHDIRVSKLIKLWAAEGILNEESESERIEEVSEDYLEGLVRRSLVLVDKRKSDGRIKSCSIHDHVREMCINQAEVDSFFQVKRPLPTVEVIKQLRRVSILDSDLDYLKNANGSTIRTMICLKGNELGFQQFLVHFRLLRILDLSNVYKFRDENDLPDQVFELFHLRYLAFSYPFNITEAISNLENLQTLIIYPRKRYRQIVKLPMNIWRMPQLTHLIVLSCKLPCQEETMLPLENLQTLSKAEDLICSREALSMVPNLKKLCITFTSRRDPGVDYELHNLIHLQKLETLKLKAYDLFKKLPKVGSPPCHPTLKKLSLKGSGLSMEDMKIVASLPNLQVLKLRNHACVGERWETTEGGFSQLTFLMIERSDLEHWITKSSHFPKLKCLVLRHCWRMSRIPHEIGEIQTLESIEVKSSNKAMLQSAKQIQEDRLSLGTILFGFLLCEGAELKCFVWFCYAPLLKNLACILLIHVHLL